MEGKMAEVKVHTLTSDELEKKIADELASLVDILATYELYVQLKNQVDMASIKMRLESKKNELEEAHKNLLERFGSILEEKISGASTNVMIALAAYKNAVGKK